MPKFKISQEYQMMAALKNLGIKNWCLHDFDHFFVFVLEINFCERAFEQKKEQLLVPSTSRLPERLWYSGACGVGRPRSNCFLIGYYENINYSVSPYSQMEKKT